METSYANGGQLSASHAEVWNHKATIVNALKWMARRDAPAAASLAQLAQAELVCGVSRRHARL
jgi:hypothetical protein